MDRPALMASCALVLACAEREPEAQVCARSARSSYLEIRIEGWQSSYGEHEHAELAFCVGSRECGTASIHAVENGFECRSNASLGAARQACMLDLSGALVIGVELLGSPETLHGEHTLTLELQRPPLDSVAGRATLRLQPVEGHGEGCGITHVFGRVKVDASLSQPVTG